MTKDERTFLDRAAAMLLERNPGLTAGSEITADMMDQAMRDTLARDQELLQAVRESEALRDVLCLEVYNRGRLVSLDIDYQRRKADEAKSANLRVATALYEMETQ